MPEPRRANCPHCAEALEIPESFIGLAAMCPHCGKQFVVHSRAKTAPPPLPDPGFIDTGNEPITRLATRGRDYFVIVSGIGALFGIVAGFVWFLSGGLASLDELSRDNPDLFSEALGMAVLVLLCAMYFVPSVIAFLREHQNSVPILVVNIFLGWSGIGWVACLAWSLSSNITESRVTMKHVR